MIRYKSNEDWIYSSVDCSFDALNVWRIGVGADIVRAFVV